MGSEMQQTSVTSKGQVTIPKQVRQQLGIRKGSKVEFLVVGDHVELRISSSPARISESGFGLLKSKQKSVPVDFDPAELLKADTVKL
jgi:AbrB family looped-hinge helix DNA binding protein